MKKKKNWQIIPVKQGMVWENTLYREYKNSSCSNHHTYNYLETHSVIAATARYPAGFSVSASSNTNNIKTISRPSYLKTIFNFLFACIQSRHQPQSPGPAERENDKLRFFSILCSPSCFVSTVVFALGISLRGHGSFHVVSSKPSEGSVYLNLLQHTF